MNVPFSINSTLLKFFWTDIVTNKEIMLKSLVLYFQKLLMFQQNIIKMQASTNLKKYKLERALEHTDLPLWIGLSS